MLIELFGRNFGCFRDNFCLSLLASDIDPDSSRGVVEARVEDDHEPLRLLRTIAIYGPNGSGKSTVLRAATALRYLIEETKRLRSDSAISTFQPFALGRSSKDPVCLGVKAVVDRRVYEYSVEFDRTTFRKERLAEIGASKQCVRFARSGQEVTGTWTEDQSFALITKDFRPNALLLSLADRLAPKLAKKIAVGLRRLLSDFNPVENFGFPAFFGGINAAKRVHKDAAFRPWLVARLRAADVGVVDLETEEIRFDNVMGFSPGNSNELEDQEEAPMHQLTLMHSGDRGPVALSYLHESLGTRRLIEISPLMYDLAHATDPRAAFVDEMDASIHPTLLTELIRHFNCEVPLERARGQLIFSTHETSLLDAEAKEAVLRRDQVYLTEKDSAGAARLYSVAEFRERNNLNMRRRYLQGRYGALPAVGTFSE